MTTYKSVPATDRARYQQILDYAFSPAEEPSESVDSGPWPPDLFQPRGIYSEGSLQSTCKLYDLRVWIENEQVEIGGLGGVATAPTARRQGRVRELCREVLSEYGDRGISLVTLWPFQTSFYATFGWATSHFAAEYCCAPGILPSYSVRGRIERMTAEQFERLQQVERSHGKRFNLSLHRTPQWWQSRTLSSWTGGTDPYLFGYHRDGEVRSYLVFTVTDETQTILNVQQLGYIDEDSYRAIISFLSNHGSQIEQIRLTLPERNTLFRRLNRPKKVTCKIKPGPMLRLTQASTINSLPVHIADTTTQVGVTDPVLDENNGKFTLNVSDGRLTLDKIDDDPESAPIRIRIGELSQLLIGARTIEELAREDNCDVRDDEALGALTGISDSRQVYHDEFY